LGEQQQNDRLVLLPGVPSGNSPARAAHEIDGCQATADAIHILGVRAFLWHVGIDDRQAVSAGLVMADAADEPVLGEDGS